MVRHSCTQVLALVTALMLLTGGCARTLYNCPPAEPPPNLDSLMNGFGGPPRLLTDSLAPSDSIRGLVLEAVRRVPVKSAEIRYRPDTSYHAVTDADGSFSLPVLSRTRVVVEVRSLGFAGRRDTVEFSRLQRHRIELTLLDAWARGDIQGVPVCTPAERGGPK